MCFWFGNGYREVGWCDNGGGSCRMVCKVVESGGDGTAKLGSGWNGGGRWHGLNGLWVLVAAAG